MCHYLVFKDQAGCDVKSPKPLHRKKVFINPIRFPVNTFLQVFYNFFCGAFPPRRILRLPKVFSAQKKPGLRNESGLFDVSHEARDMRGDPIPFENKIMPEYGSEML